jgi:hypothetical protein
MVTGLCVRLVCGVEDEWRRVFVVGALVHHSGSVHRRFTQALFRTLRPSSSSLFYRRPGSLNVVDHVVPYGVLHCKYCACRNRYLEPTRISLMPLSSDSPAWHQQ